MLTQGEEAALTSFATGFVASFDTYGACHQISISPELLARLIRSTREALGIAQDSTQRKALEAALELFSKVQAGSAGKGWISLKTNTDVTNISIVWPRWYHKAWEKVAALWRRNTA